MDLNYLFLRQQMERSWAEAARDPAARAAHEEMARQYELEIERVTGGQITFPWHRASAIDQPVSAIRNPSAWS